MNENVERHIIPQCCLFCFFLRGTDRTSPKRKGEGKRAWITETRTHRGQEVGDCMGSPRREHLERYFLCLEGDRFERWKCAYYTGSSILEGAERMAYDLKCLTFLAQMNSGLPLFSTEKLSSQRLPWQVAEVGDTGSTFRWKSCLLVTLVNLGLWVGTGLGWGTQNPIYYKSQLTFTALLRACFLIYKTEIQAPTRLSWGINKHLQSTMPDTHLGMQETVVGMVMGLFWPLVSWSVEKWVLCHLLLVIVEVPKFIKLFTVESFHICM